MNPFNSNAYLAAIVDSSDDAIISKNLDGILISWNAAAERMYGYTAAEAIGQHISLIIPPDRLEEEAAIIASLRRGQKIDHFETIRQAKDGRLLDVSITISPIRDDDGTIVGASKVARDITERKKHDEELRTQREWLQVTLASIGDAVITTDTHANVTYLNPIAENLTGWKHAEAFGKPLAEVFHIVNEDTRLPVENPVDKVLRYGTIQGLANHTLLMARDGSEYSIEDAAAPIRLSEEKLLGVVMVFHDIGDRRVLEKEVQRRDRRKDEFLAMLAHELRNPLAPISNAVNVLASETLSDVMRMQAVHLVKRQVEQMRRLLDDLLDVSRITQGKIELRRQPVLLSNIIQASIETAMPLIEERSQRLTLNMPEAPIQLIGDATRLSQIFSNLLHNAAKFSDKGEKIAIEVAPSENQVTIRIKDHGIGIAPDNLDDIFEIFAQVDNSIERKSGGLGIGLALVKDLIALHDGRVEVRSAGLGKGSEFIVTLPIMPSVPALQEERPLIPSPVSRCYRILVVDDNEPSAKTLGWMLEMLGHEVQLANDGIDALDKAKSYRPDVVFLDIGLPGMNGYQVCEAMRADETLKHTVIIAQSGWGQKEHLERSKQAGFNQHLVKPIDLQALENLLANLVSP